MTDVCNIVEIIKILNEERDYLLLEIEEPYYKWDRLSDIGNLIDELGMKLIKLLGKTDIGNLHCFVLSDNKIYCFDVNKNLILITE